jgi:ABC-type transport system substrate-binding protein
MYRCLPQKPAVFARFVLMLGALLAGIGCMPEGDSLPDDLLVIGQTAEPKSLDPHATTALNDFRILVNIYEGLVRFRDGTLEPEPALASEWETSSDGRRYTFRLREGVRFHDSTPFDAEAVRFNFERMLNADHPFHHTGPFPPRSSGTRSSASRWSTGIRLRSILRSPLRRCSPTWPIQPASWSRRRRCGGTG